MNRSSLLLFLPLLTPLLSCSGGSPAAHDATPSVGGTSASTTGIGSATSGSSAPIANTAAPTSQTSAMATGPGNATSNPTGPMSSATSPATDGPLSMPQPSATSPGSVSMPNTPPSASADTDAGMPSGNPEPPILPDAACGASNADGHFQMERLNRGLIAVRNGMDNYVGWRMLGTEYTASDEAVSYKLFRNGSLVATVTDSTNYLDKNAAADASYSVSVVQNDVECAVSESATPWAQNYISIPLEAPAAGTTPSGDFAYNIGTEERSSGSVNDGSPGDLDGDGEYEIIVKWDPSNSQDNSKAGYTGPVYIDAYKLDGTRLWRMNLGPNIRAGAHYTQFLVYDLDGDGRAEVAMRTSAGTRDGTGNFLSKGPAANDDDSKDYRNSDGYVLSGPEYLTVFDGLTGEELATADFEIGRGNVGDWGDEYGNRVDRFLASVGFVSDTGTSGEGSGRPALLMGRGYYTRATVSAWTWRNGEFTRIWTGDTNTQGSSKLAGQGAHSMMVADVDGDSAQEILYGAGMFQSDGSFGCATGLGHGDALHVSDFVPTHPGLEVFMPHEDKSKPLWDLRDAASCEIIHQSEETGADNGRGVADDILASNPGAEFWSAADSSLRSAVSGQTLSQDKPSAINFLLWWDADELRELEDGTTITKGDGTRLFQCNECMSNNYTKATPTLTADLFGDWREEIIWRTPDSSALRVYTTTAVTARRIYTLMHDPQYRMQVTSEQTGYNQPPHPGFFLGDGMERAPVPSIHIK